MDEELQGFGEGSMQELMDLRKALEIGYSDPVSGMDAPRVESLESTLKVLTYSAQNVRIWNRITKLDAFSTIEEYNRLVSYGADRGGFVPSGELPEEEDSTYERHSQKVKYVGTTRAVHHPATLVRTVPADLIAQETQNGVLWMLRKIEKALIYGDEDAIPLEWNGLMDQIIAGGGKVIDLRGGALTQEQLENGADEIVQNFGMPSVMYSNSRVFADFGKNFYQFQRFGAPNAVSGMVGTPVTGFNSQVGAIPFDSDIFITKGGAPLSAASHSKAPGVPSVSGAVQSADASSLFGSGDTGNYQYKVSAVNRFGESVPSAASASQNVDVATKWVQLTITDGGGANPATAYKVYRSDKGSTSVFNFIGILTPRSKDSSGNYQATTTHDDKNEWLPKTYVGLMLDMSVQSLAFKQLSPLIRMPLATLAPSIRWMQLLYGTPIVYAPRKNIVYKNIGELS
jgi:hypothetical protein